MIGRSLPARVFLSGILARDRLARVGGMLLGFGASKALAFAIAVLIARLYSKDIAGILFFITGLVVLSVSVTTFGLASSSSHFYPRNLARGRYNRNVQALLLGIAIAIVPSILFGAFAATLGEIHNEGLLYLAMFVTAASCFFAALRQLARTFLLAENRQLASIIYEGIVYNSAVLLVFLVLPNRDADPALWGLLFASLVGGGIALISLLRVMSSHGLPIRMSLPPVRYSRTLFRVAFPSMLAQGGALILNKADVLMIAPLAGALAVSDFSVAMRLTYLVSAAPEFLVYVFGPTLMRFGAQRHDHEGRRRVFWRSTVVTLLIVCAIGLPSAIFAGDLVTLVFGSAYGSATVPFMILLAGKLLTASFGPALVLFTSMGLAHRLALFAGLAALVNVVLNLILIPPLGAMGAAIASTVGLAIMASNYLHLAVTQVLPKNTPPAT